MVGKDSRHPANRVGTQMNLFMRFMYVLIAALRRQSSAAPLESTRLKLRVWVTDRSFSHVVPLHRIRSYTDLATINSVIRIGLGRLVRRNGWLPIIQAESIRQTGALRFAQTFEVVTSIVGWQDSYVCYVHEFFSGDQRVATSTMLARIIGRKGSPVPISEIARELGAPDQSPALDPGFLEMIAESERGRAGVIQAPSVG
jgi:acyl-CoA thioesterase FadM